LVAFVRWKRAAGLRQSSALLCRGGRSHAPHSRGPRAAPAEDEELSAVHEALERLAAHSPGKCELVKVRFFAGLTIQEAAAVLQVSEPTAKRWWTYARAWLYREIREEGAAE
jgi:DNA-directed RNA polymerase specialized sigma24 family protein